MADVSFESGRRTISWIVQQQMSSAWGLLSAESLLSTVALTGARDRACE